MNKSFVTDLGCVLLPFPLLTRHWQVDAKERVAVVAGLMGMDEGALARQLQSFRKQYAPPSAPGDHPCPDFAPCMEFAAHDGGSLLLVGGSLLDNCWSRPCLFGPSIRLQVRAPLGRVAARRGGGDPKREGGPEGGAAGRCLAVRTGLSAPRRVGRSQRDRPVTAPRRVVPTSRLATPCHAVPAVPCAPCRVCW